MRIERAARGVLVSEGDGAPDVAESGDEHEAEHAGQPGFDTHRSGVRLRAAVAEAEDSDLDSGPELPFTD